MMSRLLRSVMLPMAAVVVLGCAPAGPESVAPSHAFFLNVSNIDGPPLQIEVNGRVVADSVPHHVTFRNAVRV